MPCNRRHAVPAWSPAVAVKAHADVKPAGAETTVLANQCTEGNRSRQAGAAQERRASGARGPPHASAASAK